MRLTACPIRPFSLAEQHALERYAKGRDLTWFTNYWVPLAWRGPFVSTVHDMLHLMPDLAPTSRLNRSLSRLTFGKVRRQAAAVMFDSRFTETEFRRMVGDPRLGVTVPLGGDHFAQPAVPPLAAKEKRVLVVAAPKKHKNFAAILEAWAAARIGPDWTLTIVAPADAMRSTIDLARLSEGGRGVDLRRGITDEELSALFAASAVVATPSLYEGFGLPLLEGLRAGAVCISSAAGSLVEVAEGAFVHFVNGADRTGWSMTLEEVCAAIDRDDFAYQPLLDRNRLIADRFRWSQTASDVVAVVEGACRPAEARRLAVRLDAGSAQAGG